MPSSTVWALETAVWIAGEMRVIRSGSVLKRALQGLKHPQAEACATSYQQAGCIGGTGFRGC